MMHQQNNNNGFRREGDWDCALCGDMNFAHRDQCRKCGAPKEGGDAEALGENATDTTPPQQNFTPTLSNFKPGDWVCSNCQDVNFASRSICRKCQSPHPQHSNARPGDWICRQCHDLNFASRQQCRKCFAPHPQLQRVAAAVQHQQQQYYGAPAFMAQQQQQHVMMMMAAAAAAGGVGAPVGGFLPAGGVAHGGRFGGGGGGGGGGSNARPGDWYCPQCNDLNFASRNECRECGAVPDASTQRVGVKQGDWFCPSCQDLNFSSREVCRKCSTPKPSSSAVDE
ncbi:Zinc finger Ran-binding domain-containing protein 2 [Balamuthia mandrillaris]